MFKNLVINELIKQLSDYEDCNVYGCEIAYTLLERYNIDGTYTYSTNESRQLIKKYFEDFGEIVEDYKINYGEFNVNPFEEPEKFIVIMMLEKANEILAKCEYIDNNWNEEIELTEEVVKILKEQLKEQKNEE